MNLKIAKNSMGLFDCLNGHKFESSENVRIVINYNNDTYAFDQNALASVSEARISR